MKGPCIEARTEHQLWQLQQPHKTVLHALISSEYALNETQDCITYIDWVGVSSNSSVN